MPAWSYVRAVKTFIIKELLSPTGDFQIHYNVYLPTSEFLNPKDYGEQNCEGSKPPTAGVWGQLKSPKSQTMLDTVMLSKPLLNLKCDIHIGAGRRFVKGGTSSQVYVYI